MNKKGGIPIADLFMFLIVFTIFGLSIYIGILQFSFDLVDVRIKEARIMNDRILAIVDEKIDETSDVLDLANFDSEILKNGDFYFNLKVEDSEFDYGTRDFEVECRLGDKISGLKSDGMVCELKQDNFPGCCLRKEGNIEILTASRQKGGGIQ
jgi:hypothetical protein